MAKIPPNINNLMTVAGAVSTALRPTPLGIALTAGNLISKTTTGQSLAGNVIDAVTSPSSGGSQNQTQATSDTTQAQRDQQAALTMERMMRGVAPQKRKKASTVDPTFARGDFDRSSNSKGGVVSYKSVFDLE